MESSVYRYKRITAGQFYVYAARVDEGDLHRRVFKGSEGGFVSSCEQHTVNLYLSGSFALTCGDVEIYRFTAGENTLTQRVLYPTGHEVVETALAPGLRLCVEPSKTVTWHREIVSGEVPVRDGDVLVPTVGDKVEVLFVEGDKVLSLDAPYLLARVAGGAL